ncbi:MAG: hydroxyacid dehydrogenase [Candidatus Liptonbacteria bacterium]|nr:hydroxyacid dehydrogenase [Candidatus Liptonbacteria bacterium]
MKLAFFEIEGWEEAMIRKSFPGADVFITKDKITSLCLPVTKDFEILSVFVDSRIDKKVLDCFPNLKFITTRSTGYDHIDTAECKKRRIAVAYVPGYGDNTVAEFAFGLILNLTRKIYHGIDQIKETGSFSLTGLRGTDLKGKTIGIIGTGRIGKEMVKIANGFGMNVIAYDPVPDKKFAKEYSLAYVTFEELLKTSDILSLHTPHNEKTHHLINSKNIRIVKKGAYLVNTARGAIVETEALVNALQEGILAGVGLDVLEEEGESKDEVFYLREAHPKEQELRTMLENHILMKMPNVLITPHNAFNSQEALERILHMTIENIRNFIVRKPFHTVK